MKLLNVLYLFLIIMLVYGDEILDMDHNILFENERKI